MFVSEFKKEYAATTGFTPRTSTRTTRMWRSSRVLKAGGGPEGRDAFDNALQTNLTVVSVYGGRRQHVGTYTLDRDAHGDQA